MHKLYPEFQESLRQSGEGPVPTFEELTSDQRHLAELILRRLAIASAVRSDEVFSDINRKAGFDQDSALSLYLYITCLEPLGTAARGSRFLDFLPWLEARRGDAPLQRREVVAEFLQASEQFSMDVEKCVELVRCVFRKYKDEHGFRNNFQSFFSRCLAEQLKERIVTECWVYKVKSIEFLTPLHLIEAGYSASGSPHLQQVTDARQRWDGLDQSSRLREIAWFLEQVRNSYTHGLLPHFPPGDKDPNVQHQPLREAAEAALANRISWVSDSHYTAVRQGAWSTTLNGVGVCLREGECFVRASDLAGKDRQSWVRCLLNQRNTQFGRGDTVWSFQCNAALATGRQPATLHLRDWVQHALGNVLRADPMG